MIPRTMVASAAAALSLAAASHRPAQQPQQPTWRAVQAESGEAHLANIRQLTFGGQNAEAYFSSDGAKIVFQSTRGDHPCDQEYVMNADGSDVHRVSNGLGRTTCGYFFDHDRQVLFSSTHLAGPDCPPPPDYSHGYVWALEDFDIFTMRIDGTHVRQLTHELGYDGGPWWSHDGKRIVYRAFHPDTPEAQAKYRSLFARHLVQPLDMELWVMNADGSDRHQITHLGGANFAPYFTPDDQRIIFASNHTNPRGRNFDLYLVNRDGTGLEQITTYPDFDSFPMFSPDGKKLVWASNRHGTQPHETNIFVADWVN